MNNVGHINRAEEMDLKVAIVTALPDNPGAPVGGAEAVSVNLVRADQPHIVSISLYVGKRL